MNRMKIPTWGYAVIALLVVGAGVMIWRGGSDKSKSASAPPSVPVTVAAVQKMDFPMYQLGLGTVQGFNTVQVKTRVDGEIVKIAFVEGQTVKEGDLLVQIDPRPFQATLDAAKAKKVQDEAAINNARLDLQRSTKLGEFATRQTVDTQNSNVQQLTAQIAGDQAAIDNAQTQLDYTSIRAPIAGVTGIRMVDVGNIVTAAAGTAIVSIAQVEPISAIFTIPEQQLPAVTNAMKQGPLKVVAYTTDGKRKLSEGTLALVNNQVDATSGTIRLKATFDNKDHALWPGLSITTRLLVETVKDATVVSDDAIQHGPDGLFAFAVGKDNKAEVRKIKVRQSIDGNTLVESGLSPGEQVVVRGQYRVQEGSPLNTKVANADTSSAAKAD
jgi:multidrug efflux system membrane fusion protein